MVSASQPFDAVTANANADENAEFVVGKTYRTNRRSPAAYIWSQIRLQMLVLVLLLLGAAANATLAGLVPRFIGNAFDALQQGGQDAINVVITMGLFIIGSQALRAVLQFMRNYSAEIFAQRIERDVRDELYSSLLGKSMAYHDMQPVGDIMARVTNDVREVNFMMNPGVNLLLGSGMFLIVPIIIAPTIYPSLILVPLVFVILHVIVQYFFIRSLQPIAEKVRVTFGQMNARLAEALEGLEVVKGAAQEDNEYERFVVLSDEVRRHSIDQASVEARYLSNLLWGFSFVGMLIHAAILYNAQLITIGDAIAYVGLVYLFGFPVFTSLFSLSRIASGFASTERILSVINAKTSLGRNNEGYDEPIKGHIRFENVSFGYTPDKRILHNVSFEVEPGKTMALVGQTGSGKSTITKLINRTYEVSEGRILIDGVDVRDWSLASLRSQISVIEQDIFLFSRTIAENIAFGDDETPKDKIENAAKRAQAHDFILSFPDGYDTKIGQRGVTLSGGQRQRLAIARAFESDPPILILDDSTSAIDSATEDRIQQAIWTAVEGRTTLLITHRLSQIRWADNIVVLRHGEVVAQGTHDDLLQSSKAYQRIFARYDKPVRDQNDNGDHADNDTASGNGASHEEN